MSVRGSSRRARKRPPRLQSSEFATDADAMIALANCDAVPAESEVVAKVPHNAASSIHRGTVMESGNIIPDGASDEVSVTEFYNLGEFTETDVRSARAWSQVAASELSSARVVTQC